MRAAALVFVFTLSVGVGGCAALVGESAPEIPHATTAEFTECRSCHEQGIEGAPVTDHPTKPDCLGCHQETPDE